MCDFSRGPLYGFHAMNVLVTGSSGLIGSEAVLRLDREGHRVLGIDNNQCREFFGPEGDTRWNLERLRKATTRFTHLPLDIRERQAMLDLFARERFDLIIHCAAQPSHDKAREIPFVDFDVNAVGTLNLLEATRQSSREAVFIFMSTNKVYGDAPNELPLQELPTRWDYARPEDFEGVREDCRIDRTMHSLFGASKASADLMAQEYGRYFGLNVGVFRGGCLTGSKLATNYVDQPRAGDHICYISDVSKFRSHYPGWRISRSLDQILDRLVRSSP
jgi:CDP-paratose 2-epimerase